MTKWQELLNLLKQTSFYGYAASLMTSDRETAMPINAGPARDEISAHMVTEATRLFAMPRINDILVELLSRESELSPNQLLCIARISDMHQRAKAIPLDLVTAWTMTTSKAQRCWMETRPKSDFTTFLPHLTEVFNLARQRADAFGWQEHPYDALLPDFEPGMTVELIKTTLFPLRTPLTAFVGRLAAATSPDDTCLRGFFPLEAQKTLSTLILRKMGFDFNSGRFDFVPGHPMTITVGPRDIRITTRSSLDYLGSAMFAAIHEGGHALYEQGKAPELDWVYTDTGVSMAIHESQSRMWENLIGRSLPFWQYFYWQLQALIPTFDSVALDKFWRAINVVRPSLIRVEADEVTYNLHIMLRTELEMAILNKELSLADLPDAWNEKFKDYFGITPPDHKLGCMQDIHWSTGYIGYFPSYALGNLLAAQLWQAIITDIPEIENDISQGNLSILLSWLRQKIHTWGLMSTLPELAQRVTGKPLDPQVWMHHITEKYIQVYDL